MTISIILLNFNGLENTLDCLRSLSTIDKKGFSVTIIVVDNNSEDKSAQVLAKQRGIKFIKNESNLGFSAGNNVGIRYALSKGSNYVMILNNDTTVDPSLVQYLSVLAKRGDIISPKIYFAKGHEFHKKRYKKDDLGKVIWYAGGQIDWQNILGVHSGVDEVDHGQYNKPRQVDFATGACMLVKREVFEKIGLFDEKYFLYLEDMDLCVRASKIGFKIIYQPKAKIWHKNAASTGGSGSSLQDYYITRSRLLFALKFATLRAKMALFKQISLQSVSNPVKRKALIDFARGYFGPASNLNR